MAWTRRDFVKASALAIPAAAVPSTARAQQPGAPGTPAAAPPAPPVFTPLRRNVGIFHQRGGTIGWLLNSDGLLVVDSQFADTAPNLLSGLKERSPRSIDVLINSHHHPDHTGGNGVLRPSAKQIVAHARSKENQRAAAEKSQAQVTLPDVTFTDTWSVTLGDETIRAKHWGPAHTGGDASIHFERANVVHLGDLLNNRGYPNVDAPAGASVQGWIRVLEQMAPAYPADALVCLRARGSRASLHRHAGRLALSARLLHGGPRIRRPRAQGRPLAGGTGQGGSAAAFRALRGHQGAPRTGAHHRL